jgi:hypothetical protein
VSMPIERSEYTNGASTQPESVVTLLRQLGLRNTSGVQEADALRAWVRDNIPNRALRLSIRRNGYRFLLDHRFGGPLPHPTTSPA